MDKREHPRIRKEEVVGLDVLVVPSEGQSVRGRLVDMSATGAGVTIAASERPRLMDAERVVLVIGADQLDPPVTAPAVTLHQETRGDERHVGFRFVDPEALMETLSGSYWTLFNARRAPRVKAQPHEPITAAVWVPIASGVETEPVEGAVEDISAIGLSLELPVEIQPDAVTEGAMLHLVVRVPGGAELTLAGIVRDCVPLGDRWRVGVEFDPEATPEFEASQAGIEAYLERRRAEEGSEA